MFVAKQIVRYKLTVKTKNSTGSKLLLA
ncbi:hypothetical protein AVEN_231980-1, partial [Araneus ventricosus]